MNISENYSKHLPELESVDEWFDQEYNAHFSVYFVEARELFGKMERNQRTCPISDAELEWILACLPIKLFQVSEELNKYRLSCELIKIQMKKMKRSAQEEDIDSLLDDELLLSAMASVVTRVEGEISFSRELIMGAKKIWDSRRRTEESMPVSEGATLPDYKVPTTKAYVK